MQIIKIKVPATRLRKTRRQYTIILNVDYRHNSYYVDYRHNSYIMVILIPYLWVLSFHYTHTRNYLSWQTFGYNFSGHSPNIK